MDATLLDRKINTLLEEIQQCVESKSLNEQDLYLLRDELDKLLYECLYYKNKLVS